MQDEQTTCIPNGIYCYELIEIGKDKNGRSIYKTHVCPYWSIDRSKPNQMNGYCAYLDCGDWEGEGFGLLWDQVKECGINEEWNDE